jgi:hypothetical protein
LDTYLNLSPAADLLAELTSNPRIKDDIVRIIMLGAEGKIPIFWRNSLHIWTRIFSQVELLPREELEPMPDTEASPNWMQIGHFALCDLELYQQTECWTFKIDNEDILNLMHRGEPLVTDLGLEMWVRHQIDYENVTIDRDQLYIVENHLRKYAATLAPEKVADVDQVPPEQATVSVPPDQTTEAATVKLGKVKKLPWWQVEYQIHEMAQNIGAKFHEEDQKKPKPDPDATSVHKISVEIEKRINDMERRSARDRRNPSSDTIRGSLTGWKFTPK